MRQFWGTLGGALLGILGGPFGALFGALVGFLIDLVAVDMRVRRETVRFLEHSSSPRWLPRAAVLCSSLYGELHRRRSAARTVESSMLALAVMPLLPGTFTKRNAESLVAASVSTWPDEPTFHELVAALGAAEERERVFAVAWQALREAGNVAPIREEFHTLARRGGLDEGFIARELVVREMLDPEACSILGVSRDAMIGEIRTAYRRLAAQFHPDTAMSLSEAQREATEDAFKRIQRAYETLRAELAADD